MTPRWQLAAINTSRISLSSCLDGMLVQRGNGEQIFLRGSRGGRIVRHISYRFASSAEREATNQSDADSVVRSGEIASWSFKQPETKQGKGLRNVQIEQRKTTRESQG